MDNPESMKKDLSEKTRDFLEVFKKGEEFTQELLKENERLRYKIAELENEIKKLHRTAGDANISDLQNAFSQLQQEKDELASEFREVEAENKDFAQKYVEVEDENNNLANLYVASYQLHSTLDKNEVFRILQEIVINLVGADRFSIIVLEEERDSWTPIIKEGVDDAFLKKVKSTSRIIDEVIQTGDNYFQAEIDPENPGNESEPIVCIPLKIKDRTIGVLVIFSLLEQKRKKLTRVDYELFSMLAGHAATAIFSSQLYSVSERKLSTIQGFIDLLSGKGK